MKNVLEREQGSEKQSRANHSPDKEREFGKSFDKERVVYALQRKLILHF